MKRKKFVYGMMLTAIVFFLSVPTYAENKKDEVDIVGESAIVTDLESGYVLYEKNENKKQYPASITKIMTALIVLENRDLDEEVTYTKEGLYSIESGSSAAYIKPGETLTVEQSLYVMMLHSANDIAHGLAYELGGDLQGFSQMMNKKAEELGCKNTHFVNASGLSNKEHYTTASDMAKIAKAAYENEVLRKIMGTYQYELPATNKYPSARTWTNGNRMIREGSQYYYEPCMGGKTGYTVAAGGTLVTYAKIQGRMVSCVILKSTNSATTYQDSIQLYDYTEKNMDISMYEESKMESETDEMQQTQENILYHKEVSLIEKIIYVIKVIAVIFIVLVAAIISRIIYVQYQRKKRRERRRRMRKRRHS